MEMLNIHCFVLILKSTQKSRACIIYLKYGSLKYIEKQYFELF